jgi:hypothetical protein
MGRTPPQFSLDFACVNGISSVMARAIRDKLDESLASFFSRSPQARVKKLAKEIDNLNILPLSIPTYVVCFAWSSLFKDPD